MLSVTPMELSITSSTNSIPSVESISASQHIPRAADISATVLTASNTQIASLKAMEECPELMVVMARVESGLQTSCVWSCSDFDSLEEGCDGASRSDTSERRSLDE